MNEYLHTYQLNIRNTTIEILLNYQNKTYHKDVVNGV